MFSGVRGMVQNCDKLNRKPMEECAKKIVKKKWLQVFFVVNRSILKGGTRSQQEWIKTKLAASKHHATKVFKLQSGMTKYWLQSWKGSHESSQQCLIYKKQWLLILHCTYIGKMCWVCDFLAISAMATWLHFKILELLSMSVTHYGGHIGLKTCMDASSSSWPPGSLP